MKMTQYKKKNESYNRREPPKQENENWKLLIWRLSKLWGELPQKKIFQKFSENRGLNFLKSSVSLFQQIKEHLW